MFQVRRKETVAYEDLMRELSVMEQRMLAENSSIAMDLMVLDAKIRERFQRLEMVAQQKVSKSRVETGLTVDDIRALIPQDLPAFPSINDIERSQRKKKIIETVATAALLAVFTALGVFGLASVLQLGLSWLA